MISVAFVALGSFILHTNSWHGHKRMQARCTFLQVRVLGCFCNSEKAFALSYAVQIIRSIADVVRMCPAPNQESWDLILGEKLNTCLQFKIIFHCISDRFIIGTVYIPQLFLSCIHLKWKLLFLLYCYRLRHLYAWKSSLGSVFPEV